MGGTVSGLAAIMTLGFVWGMGGTVSGLAAIMTLGFVWGMGGTVSGLAAIMTLGFVWGMGGTVSGLAAISTLGLVWGIGGTVSGLAAMVTLGFVCGIGGTVSGLAIAYVAVAANAANKTEPRIETILGVITWYSFARKLLRIQRVTQKGYTRYNKSDIARNFFSVGRSFSSVCPVFCYGESLISPFVRFIGGQFSDLFAWRRVFCELKSPRESQK